MRNSVVAALLATALGMWLASSQPQAGQAENRASPTLDETYEWLQGHLEQNVIPKNGGEWTVHVESVDRCRVVVTGFYPPALTSTGTEPNVWRHVFLLKDLDPEHHRIEPLPPPPMFDKPIGWSLTMSTHNGKDTILWCAVADETCQSPLRYREITLPFAEKDVAERASKAFRHAILLCGGRPAVF